VDIVANGDSSGSHNGLLYGIIGALCVVVIGGGFYIFQAQDKPVEPAVQAAKPAPPPLPPPPVATPRPSPPPAPAAPAGPSAAQIGQARNLIADARRFASLGDFAGAETALQNADKAAPGFAEVAQARRDIAEMRTAGGQLRPLIERTRRAIERGDFATAERTLGEAERIDANAPEVVDMRRELRAAERQGYRQQDGRVTVLVTAARAAIALGDLAAADRALGQAEQVDPRDPAVIQARADFYAAERAARLRRN
jgi:tetratricopeptide (TPR) repeat protein